MATTKTQEFAIMSTQTVLGHLEDKLRGMDEISQQKRGFGGTGGSHGIVESVDFTLRSIDAK